MIDDRWIQIFWQNEELQNISEKFQNCEKIQTNDLNDVKQSSSNGLISRVISSVEDV